MCIRDSAGGNTSTPGDSTAPGGIAMILRRLTQSLKAQNWTAIWIEFVLLVLGVFLGIQVSNWNATRIEQQKSAEFTQRLKSDLRVEAWNYEMQILSLIHI